MKPLIQKLSIFGLVCLLIVVFFIALKQKEDIIYLNQTVHTSKIVIDDLNNGVKKQNLDKIKYQKLYYDYHKLYFECKKNTHVKSNITITKNRIIHPTIEEQVNTMKRHDFFNIHYSYNIYNYPLNYLIKDDQFYGKIKNIWFDKDREIYHVSFSNMNYVNINWQLKDSDFISIFSFRKSGENFELRQNRF
jgi:hypothetical protein